jgi:hypothetical protein
MKDRMKLKFTTKIGGKTSLRGEGKRTARIWGVLASSKPIDEC